MVVRVITHRSVHRQPLLWWHDLDNVLHIAAIAKVSLFSSAFRNGLAGSTIRNKPPVHTHRLLQRQHYIWQFSSIHYLHYLLLSAGYFRAPLFRMNTLIVQCEIARCGFCWFIGYTFPACGRPIVHNTIRIHKAFVTWFAFDHSFSSFAFRECIRRVGVECWPFFMYLVTHTIPNSGACAMFIRCLFISKSINIQQ